MKTTLKLFLFIAIIFSISCSNGDDDNEPILNIPANISFLSEDNPSRDLLIVDIEGDSSNVNTTNLTELTGIDNSFRLLEREGRQLTFVNFNTNDPVIVERNLDSGINQTLSLFCDNDQLDRTIQRITTTPQRIVAVLLDLEGFLSIESYHRNTASCQSLIIGDTKGRGTLLNSIISGGEHVAFLLRDENDFENNQLVVVDLENNRVSNTMLVRFDTKITMSDNEIITFKPNDTYVAYDFGLNETRSGVFQFNNISTRLPLFATQFNGDQFLGFFSIPQPAETSSAPVALELDNSDEVTTDRIAPYFNAISSLKLSTNGSLNSISYDLSKNLVVFGFDIRNSGGRIIYTNFDGEVLLSFETELVPSLIIIQ